MDILWLASWYPNKTDPFNGDFIQRHAAAVAASARCRVTMIHVAKDARGLASWETETTVSIHGSTSSPGGSLTETISYFRPLWTPFSTLNRLLSQVRAFRLYAKAIRRYIREHGRPPFIHVHVCMNAGILALWAKYRLKIPYLVTEHFTAYIPGSEGDYYSRPFVYRWVNKRILAGASGVHNVSLFLQNCQEAITPLACPAIIPNAVDISVFRPAVHRRTGPFRFIHVSSFHSAKNVIGLLEGFALLGRQRTDWELTLIGPAGEDTRNIAKGWKSLDGRLRWTGELSYREVGAQLQQADAMVLFSRVENQPCVISEALCCGVPVISSAVGGIPEDLTPAEGILVREGDVPALAGALDRMMRDYDRFDRPGIARAASDRYGYDSVGRRIMAYYASIFRGGGPDGEALGGTAPDGEVPGGAFPAGADSSGASR